MARVKAKAKATAEYFKHYVGQDKIVYALESEFGNDGYIMWYKLQEFLCQEDYHYFDISKTVDFSFMASYLKLSKDTIIKIFHYLIEIEAIDKDLFMKNIIWSEILYDNLVDLYVRRQSPLIGKQEILNKFKDNVYNKSVEWALCQHDVNIMSAEQTLCNKMLQNETYKNILEENILEKKTEEKMY